MCFASSGQKTSAMSSSSHVLVRGDMRSDTLLRTVLPLGVIGHLVALFGIQGLLQMLILLPSPTRHIKPFFRAPNLAECSATSKRYQAFFPPREDLPQDNTLPEALEHTTI